MSGKRALGFLTTKQVAELTGLSLSRVQRLVFDGRIDAVKMSGRWLVYEDSAYAFAAKPRQTGRPPKGQGFKDKKAADQLALDLEK